MAAGRDREIRLAFDAASHLGLFAGLFLAENFDAELWSNERHVA